MQWDLGLQGVGLLIVMSLVFGAFSELVFRGTGIRWVWLIGSAGFFVLGLFISEGLFGGATGEDLQPNIDGLSFDEVLLGYVIGVPVVLIARYLIGRRGPRPMAR